jgi:hypothetical protein
MGHEQIRVKKGSHASQGPNVKSGPVPLNTNTHQSPLTQHYRNLGNEAVQRMIEAGAIQSKFNNSGPNERKAGPINEPPRATLANIKAEVEEPTGEEPAHEPEPAEERLTEEPPIEETPTESEGEESPAEEAAGAGGGIIEPINIVRDKDIWWFNGENAANYDEEGKLTAWGGVPGATRGTFQWDVVRGTTIIDFQNGSDSMTRVNANRVGIKSTDRSTTRGDVRVRCRWSLGGRSRTLYHSFTVWAPETAVVVAGPTDSPWGTGFQTSYTMEVRDQFGTAIPKRLEVNEDFGAWVSDFPGETWGTPPPNGAFTGPPAPAVSQFIDEYGARYAPGTRIPDPVNPGAAGWTTPVKHAPQYYRAGSTVVGRGRLIKTHRMQFYRGRGRQI